MVGRVLPDLDLRRVTEQAHLLAVSNDQQPALQLLVRRDRDGHPRAPDGGNVASRVLDMRIQPAPVRVLVLQPDVLHMRHPHDAHNKLAAAHAPRLHVVAQRLAHSRKAELVARALKLRPHRRGLPVHAALELRMDPHGPRFKPDDARGHVQPPALANGRVPRLHEQLIERVSLRHEPPRPESGRAVLPVAGPRRAQPHEAQHGHAGRRGEGGHRRPADDRVQRHRGRRSGRLARQQRQQRAGRASGGLCTGMLVGPCPQPSSKLRRAAFRLIGGAPECGAAQEPAQGQHQCANGRRQEGEQQNDP